MEIVLIMLPEYVTGSNRINLSNPEVSFVPLFLLGSLFDNSLFLYIIKREIKKTIFLRGTEGVRAMALVAIM